MPYARIHIQEGFYTEDTHVDASNRWVDGDHIRFVTDVPEKIGGWQKFTSQQYQGICRCVVTWPTFDNDKYLAFGTNLKLYVLYEGNIYDITPYRTGGSIDNPFSIDAASTTLHVYIPDHGLSTGDQIWFYNKQAIGGTTAFGVYAVTVVNSVEFTVTLALPSTSADGSSTSPVGGMVGYSTSFKLTNPFSVSSGSNVVTVTSANHGCLINDFVYFQNASSIGGLDLNGEWQITRIIDKDTFQFVASGNASSTTNGGGTVYYLYEINTGASDQSAGFGYGASTYGIGAYGTPREILAPTQAFPRVWTLDIWGSDLVAAPRDGGICYWTAQTGSVTNRAVPLPNAPSQVKSIAVWPESQILIAFGSSDTGLPGATGYFNPMLIRVCDEGNPTVWIPDPITNTSAFYLLTDGSQIMQAVKMRGQVLLSTDTALYSMYEDASNLFGFRMNSSMAVMSPNSMVEANGIVIIYGEEQFYVFDGTVRALKCDIRQEVFFNFNYTQTWKVFGAHNSAFNEIWWFYPSASAMENDRYAIYNYQKNIWYFGTMARTCFTDKAEVAPYPLAFGSDSYLYSQEVGFNAGAEPLVAYIQSGDLVIAERNRFVYVKNVVPDLLINNTPIQFSMSVRRFPESPAMPVGTYTITPGSTDVIGTRAKGGQISFSYTISALNSNFKGGDVEVLLLPAGTK